MTLRLLILLLTLTETAQAVANKATSGVAPRTCDLAGGYYLDTTSFRCVQCADSEEVDRSTGPDADGNHFQCKCRSGYRAQAVSCSSDRTGLCSSVQCVRCEGASSADRLLCLQCDGSTSGINEGDCLCPLGGNGLPRRLVESKGAGVKSCEECPVGEAVVLTAQRIAGVAYTGDAYSCQRCPDPLMTFQKASDALVCLCPPDYTTTGASAVGPQSCVPTAQASPFVIAEVKASTVAYPRLGSSVQSIVLQHYYVKAVTGCTYFGGSLNLQDCQTLANLCVLQLYDDTATACVDFLAIYNARSSKGVYDVAAWSNALPWIYYNSAGVSASTVCSDTTFSKHLSLGKFLNYFVASYTLNGTYLGLAPLDTFFSYCSLQAPLSSQGGGDSSNTYWQFFANSQILDYQCDLSLLLEEEQRFHELFIFSNRRDLYHPVPVRIVDVLSNGARTNNLVPRRVLCDEKDVLVRRFFLYDIVSGVSTASPSSPSVIRYASNISLTFQIRPDQSNAPLAPVLTIQYAEVRPSSWKKVNEFEYLKTPTGKYTFKAQYTMDPAAFLESLLTCFIIATVLAGLVFILRISNWNKRNTRVVSTVHLTTDLGGVNMTVLLQATLLAIHSWVVILFVLVTLTSWYWFVFFKLQRSVSVMLPPEGRNFYDPNSFYYSFYVVLHILVVFQVIYVAVLVYRQSALDIFLIDWEPARGKGNAENRVSIWRTILVANEWVELMCCRRVNVTFTLFWIGFFLYYLRLENNATAQPELSNKDPGPANPILRFANSTFFWLILSYAQWLWKFLIAERYIGEPPEQAFVDLCTIAKVSVIVLDEKYHGYYLHCRSPHAFADGTMAELVDMLHKEEAGLTTDRSLEGAPKDVQSFEVFVSGEWRDSFDKIYSALAPKPNVNEVIKQGRLRGGAARGGAKLFAAQAPERALKATRELTMFLKEFIENSFGKPSLKRTVRESTYVERMFGIPPLLTSLDQPSIFFPDRSFRYIRVCLLGQEADLLLLNILIYSICDVWFGSAALSILLTFLVDGALMKIRHILGKAMIAKKTMVDERFLI